PGDRADRLDLVLTWPAESAKRLARDSARRVPEMVGVFGETRGAERPAPIVVDVERSGRIRGVHRPVRLAQADPVDERHALDPLACLFHGLIVRLMQGSASSPS